MKKIKTAFIIMIGITALMRSAAAAPCTIAGQTVVDQAGRKITVTQPFKRIISLYGAHTENLFGLGLNTEIVGVSRGAHCPPQAPQKTIYSYHDDAEKFLGARPDLVLIRPMIDRGYPALVQRLEQSGITVLSLQPGSIDEMFVYWQILGVLTGKQAQACDMVQTFKQAVRTLDQKTRAIDPKKKVYFESIHNKMKTFTRNAMAIFALETAGGINIAADAISSRGTNVANYGKERILAHAGEIDVYLAQKGTMNQPTISLIKTEPGFHLIRAVRENQVFIINEMLVSRPTPRLLEGVLEIGRCLYPEVFTPAFLQNVAEQENIKQMD